MSRQYNASLRRIRHLCLLAVLCSLPLACAVPEYSASARETNNECVVLLHGLARGNGSMRQLQKALLAQHYTVLNIDYPSTRYSVEDLVEQYVRERIQAHCDDSYHKIHFITHSMGGILTRYLLKSYTMPNLGRVVMLSPPNQGSEIVDKLGSLWLFKWLNGPAGQQLGTDKESLPQRLGPVDFELGVITGDRSMNPLLSMLIPGDDDGKVAVQRAGVAGMDAFLVVPYNHTFIMRKQDVIAQSIAFLQEGKFTNALQN